MNFTDYTVYLTLFVLMLLEGASFPIPSEIVLPLIGYLHYKQVIDIHVGIVVATLGSLTGSLIDYYIASKFGRPFLYKYGRFFKLNQDSLNKLELWFNKYGTIAVFIFRFVPVMRTLISFPAGLARMNLKSFIVLTFFGHLIWNTILAYLGLVFASDIERLITTLESYLKIIFIAFLIVVILYVFYRFFLSNRVPKS